jgi:hypothetical protein
MALSPLDIVPMPDRIAKLPRDHRGYAVPFFVQFVDGKPVFPLFDPVKWMRCVGHKLCWICGEPLGRNYAFPLGPMCTINRVSSEPPSHLDCVVYALQVCPFLVNPRMVRVPVAKLGEVRGPGGEMDEGNPGVMAIWMTRSYSLLDTPTGPLIEVGDPFAVTWFSRGRAATPQEAADAFIAGAAKLMTNAGIEAGEDGIIEVTRLIIPARRLLPDPDLVREIIATPWPSDYRSIMVSE